MSGPLAGKSIVVTRASEQAGAFAGMLKSAGAVVVELPTIMTVPPESYDGLDKAIRGLADFDYIVFTSVNALKFFFDRLHELGKDARALGRLDIIAVGPKTAAELDKLGLKADIVPEEFKAEGVIKALEAVDVKGKRFFYPRAEVAREVLPEMLRGKGAVVEVAVAYRTVAPEKSLERVQQVFSGEVSAITFTSSSTVKNFAAMAGEKYKEYLKGVCVACIGPVTAKTCEELGIPVCVVPRDYTTDALVDALVEYFGRRKDR